MQLTAEHEQIRSTLKKFIDVEINPYVDEWEEAEIFPAHQVFKGLGDLGLLGVNKPVEYGGMGLDWSYAAVVAETLGHINCGAVPMAIGAVPFCQFGPCDQRPSLSAVQTASPRPGCVVTVRSTRLLTVSSVKA